MVLVLYQQSVSYVDLISDGERPLPPVDLAPVRWEWLPVDGQINLLCLFCPLRLPSSDFLHRLLNILWVKRLIFPVRSLGLLSFIKDPSSGLAHLDAQPLELGLVEGKGVG